MDYKKNAVTCLIPFYNEDERIFDTLDLITKAKNIDQIICVDDGSDDYNHKIIKKKYPQIEVIRIEQNQGKSSAMLHGLVNVKTEWVFFLDADLEYLQISEIDDAIDTVLKAKNTDMLILRRANYSAFVTLIRHDILMSGERILRTQDALAVYKKPPSGYQLEVAINLYMLKNKKNCFWQQTSLANSYKINKWSFTEAIKKYLEEIGGYASYDGPVNYLKQLKDFCREEHP